MPNCRTKKINTTHKDMTPFFNTIAKYGGMTPFFDKSITQDEMYEMLKYGAQFSEAEIKVIIAALVLSNARFKDEVN